MSMCIMLCQDGSGVLTAIQDLLNLCSQASSVSDLTFIHNKPNLLITGSLTQHCQTWDIGQGTVAKKLLSVETSSPIKCVVSEGRLAPHIVYVALQAGLVGRIDLRTAKNQLSMICGPLNPGHRHRGAVKCLCLNDSALFTGGADRTVRLWDLRMESKLLEKLDCCPASDSQTQSERLRSSLSSLPPHQEGVRALVLSDDAKWLVSRGGDFSDTRVWNCGWHNPYATYETVIFDESEEEFGQFSRRTGADTPQRISPIRMTIMSESSSSISAAARPLLLTGGSGGVVYLVELNSGRICHVFSEHLSNPGTTVLVDEEGIRGPRRSAASDQACSSVLCFGEGLIVGTSTGDIAIYESSAIKRNEEETTLYKYV